jgi:hypothetical protein
MVQAEVVYLYNSSAAFWHHKLAQSNNEAGVCLMASAPLSDIKLSPMGDVGAIHGLESKHPTTFLLVRSFSKHASVVMPVLQK